MTRFNTGLAKLTLGVAGNKNIDVCIRIDVARDAICCFATQSNRTPVMAAQVTIHAMGWRKSTPD
jgi:hypothetical protein